MATGDTGSARLDLNSIFVIFSTLKQVLEYLFWKKKLLLTPLPPHNLDVLTSQLDNDSDETCRVKALYAISCITRDTPAALAAFAALDGWSVLLRAIQVRGINK